MRYSRTLLFGAALAAFAALAAAGCDDDNPGVGCVVDGDCRGERVCVEGVCEAPEVSGGDSGVTSGQDTSMVSDSGGREDTSPEPDTSEPDTSEPDTSEPDTSEPDVGGDVPEACEDAQCASTYDCCAQTWICHDADNPPITCDLACAPPVEDNLCGCHGEEVCQYGPEPGNLLCAQAVTHLLDECGYDLESIREELPGDYALIAQMQEAGCQSSFIQCYANCMAYPIEDACSTCHFGEQICERDVFDECVSDCPRGLPETMCALTGGTWDDSDCADCCGPTRCGEDPEEPCGDACCGSPQCVCPAQAPFWSPETGCFSAGSCDPTASCPPGAPADEQMTTPVITTDPDSFLGQELTLVGTLTTQPSVDCDDLGPCGTCYPGLALDGVISLRGPEGAARELCGATVGCQETTDTCLPVWDCYPAEIGRRVRVRGTFDVTTDSPPDSFSPWRRLVEAYGLTIQGFEVISPVSSGGRFAGTLTVDEVMGADCNADELIASASLEAVVATSSEGIMVEFMAPGAPSGFLPLMNGWHTGQLDPEGSGFSVDGAFLGSFSGRFVEGGLEGTYDMSLSGPDCRILSTFQAQQVY